MLYTASIIIKHGNDCVIVCSRKREDAGDTNSTAVGSIWRWDAAHADIGMLVEFDASGSFGEGI
jgi:hypothetical protein